MANDMITMMVDVIRTIVVVMGVLDGYGHGDESR